MWVTHFDWHSVHRVQQLFELHCTLYTIPGAILASVDVLLTNKVINPIQNNVFFKHELPVWGPYGPCSVFYFCSPLNLNFFVFVLLALNGPWVHLGNVNKYKRSVFTIKGPNM